MDTQSRRLSVSISMGRWLIWVTHVNQWLSKNRMKKYQRKLAQKPPSKDANVRWKRR
jgi:hypothetical protein